MKNSTLKSCKANLVQCAYIDPETDKRETFVVSGGTDDSISQAINIVKRKLNCRLCFPQWNKELQAYERPS